MRGFIQVEPDSKNWKEGFFSEFLAEGKTVPGFERFIATTSTVEGDEDYIRGLLLEKGEVSKFEVLSQEGTVICLGVMEDDRKTTPPSFWKRLFKKSKNS